ncbi:MAG TPA: carboxypeptidase-like regulatory domain-containing protein, partial [Rhodothermia bacterium]|nr:carboxypeptidase-like regulatory domain-containing protein [Rhodothermia bacterium]
GRYDLRFSSPGWVPEFRFGFDVAAAGGSDLRLQFVKGASLSGWIEAVARRETVEGTEVSLAVEAREQRRKLYLARANAKGWFQFKGIPPGEYLLSASRSRFVSQVHSVKILADRAADLRVPLVLDEPKRLTVQIMPPLDHDGLPWKVRLTRNDPRLRFSDVVAEASASNAGEWQREGLIGGTYDVEILCAKGGIWGDGATWTHQDITIGAEDVTVVVNASPRTLTGRITLGGRPLQSAIQFGGVDGPKLQTDEKGRFAGAIPPGDAAEPQQIIIEADTPQVRRTLMRTIETNDEGRAYLEVDLPATTLMGKVIREDRSPVPQAILNFSGEDHVLDQLMSAGDGGFQIAGLAAGKYRISVDAGDLAGDVYPVILEEGEIVETDLVVKPIVKVSGRITGPGDVPVVAAKVLLFSRDAWHSLLSPRFTNGDGLFEFTLPPGTTMYDGIAAHPAFDVVMARAKIHEGQSIRIRTAQLGGTVTIEAKDPGRLYVVYAGARIPVSVVARMAGGAVELERATLPRMRPGHYSVCNGETLHCVRGDLPPHGSVTLKMDEQAAAFVR